MQNALQLLHVISHTRVLGFRDVPRPQESSGGVEGGDEGNEPGVRLGEIGGAVGGVAGVSEDA